jgi:DNA-binding MarR family transcriptional regulator
VYLTDKGRELREPVERRWETVEERAFAGVSSEEKTLLRNLLSRLHDNLTREPNSVQ